MPRPADPCVDYTRAALARTRALIDQREAERANTAALIAEPRMRIGTHWRCCTRYSGEQRPTARTCMIEVGREHKNSPGRGS